MTDRYRSTGDAVLYSCGVDARGIHQCDIPLDIAIEQRCSMCIDYEKRMSKKKRTRKDHDAGR